MRFSYVNIKFLIEMKKTQHHFISSNYEILRKLETSSAVHNHWTNFSLLWGFDGRGNFQTILNSFRRSLYKNIWKCSKFKAI